MSQFEAEALGPLDYPEDRRNRAERRLDAIERKLEYLFEGLRNLVWEKGNIQGMREEFTRLGDLRLRNNEASPL